MANEHSTCKRHALKLIAQISYNQYCLRDMILDNCPVTRSISLEDLTILEDVIIKLRDSIRSSSCEKENRNAL